MVLSGSMSGHALDRPPRADPVVTPTSPDDYLASLDADKRATLERVRRAIRAAAPGANEGMSYGLPAFSQGKPLAAYAASANHCAYYPMSGAVVAALQTELQAYETSKGAIRFPVGKPLPASLIRKLVRARLAEIGAARATKEAATPAARTSQASSTKKAAKKASGRVAGKAPATVAGKASTTASARVAGKVPTKVAGKGPRTAGGNASGKAPRTAGGNASAKAAGKAATKAARRVSSETPSVEAVLSELRRNASKRFRADMAARYGIVTQATVYGVPMAKLKLIAKRLGRDHALATSLWGSGAHDARMLATLVAEPERITRAQMALWARDFDNWALVDTACFNAFDRTPHAFAQIEAWAAAKNEFVRRAAFALLACAALHGRGTDADYQRGLTLIEAAAEDSRNFVKKGVSWALRAIGGKKSPTLRAEARTLARELAASENAARRWIGKDALRAFAKR